MNKAVKGELSNKGFPVDVSPEMQMYVILQHLNYKLETAYAEFIDNSIQSFLENENRLLEEDSDSTPTLTITIDISTTKKQITIKDDAFGIKREDMQRALKLGIELNTVHSPDSLSVYGIGMKSSAIWFTNSWSVKSSAYGASEALNFEFDLPALLTAQKTSANVLVEPADYSEHYTKIVLNNHIREESEDHYRDHIVPFIEETFHKFKDKVKIEFRFDGKLIEANKKKTSIKLPAMSVYPPVDKNGSISRQYLIEWKVDLNFKFQGKPVSGFIMIRKTGGYNHPGIRLIRNKRVIRGVSVANNIVAEITGTANKFVAEKLYGELNLDAFPVDFMKTNFNQNLKELYQELKRILAEDFAFNMLSQAQDYRKKVADKPENKQLVESLKSKKLIKKLLKKGQAEGSEPDPDIGVTAVHDTSEGSESEPDTSAIPGENNESDGDNVVPLVSIDEAPPKEPELEEQTSSGTSNGSLRYGIEKSQKLYYELTRLNNDKIINLYESLCVVSLNQHSVLMYSGAWAFVEIFSAAVGRQPSSSFPEFLGPKVNVFYKTDRTKKNDIKRVLDDISERGNCTKHSDSYFQRSASDINNYFKILEPFFILLIDQYLNANKK